MTVDDIADTKDLVAKLQQQISSISSSSVAKNALVIDALSRAAAENARLQKKLKALCDGQWDTRTKCLQYQELIHSAKAECDSMKTEMEQYKSATQEMLAKKSNLIASKVRAAVSKLETRNSELNEELAQQQQYVRTVEIDAAARAEKVQQMSLKIADLEVRILSDRYVLIVSSKFCS